MRIESFVRSVCGLTLAASLAACGGGGAGGTGINPSPTAQNVNVPLIISDASSADWATIGVKILSVALVPQGGGSNVIVYSAPSPVPVTNLVQLDDLGDVIGNPSVPAGTYTGAVITVSANPGDVSLVVSSDPESGFGAPAGSIIPMNSIQIQHATGSTGSLTTGINVAFESPVTFATGQTTPVDLDFDLSHPAFIVEHTPPALAGSTLWAVNFDGPVRHHPLHDIRALVLRHLYGSVTGVSTDNTTLSLTKDEPTYPAATPETATSTGVALSILADATDGTLFYNLDTHTVATIKDFSSVASVLAAGEYVRVAARYQQDGTLVAVRIWASSSFNSVWVSPEGHVRHVDTTNDIISVDNEDGIPVQMTVNANTQFFFRTPANALADATPIGKGPGFLAGENLVRGFKVHATVVDPLAVPLVAQTIDIETARYGGRISNADATSFDYTAHFFTSGDDYQVTLPYIASTTAQNPNASGNATTGFQWWNYTFPTLADTGSTAIADFVSATTGAGVTFGTVAVNAAGVTDAIWGDPANANGWSAPWAVLLPVELPLGDVTTAFSLSGNSATFAMAPASNTSATPVNVDVSTATGTATLAYQVDRTNGIVTVSKEDLTTAAGQQAVTTGMAVGAPVRLYAVPEANGNLKAYALFYFTGMQAGS